MTGFGDGFAQLAPKLAEEGCPVHHLSYNSGLDVRHVYVEPFITLAPRSSARELALLQLNDASSVPLLTENMEVMLFKLTLLFKTPGLLAIACILPIVDRHSSCFSTYC